MASGVPARDQYNPQYERKVAPTGQILRPMQEFKTHKTSVPMKVFKPDGSFDSLKEQGKLSDPTTFNGDQARNSMREKKYFMPGYTGFVRGKQHIEGRTYGEMTRRAYDTDFTTHACTSPIPSAPNCNRKIVQEKFPNTFVSNNLSDRRNHVPGYTGHVPGTRATYSKTFGETTLQEMAKFDKTHPRVGNTQQEGYAKTHMERHTNPLSSNPLPGTGFITMPPKKMIEKHIKHLAFFSR